MLQNIENDALPDYKLFAKVLVETERLFSGVIKAIPLELMNAELANCLNSLLEKDSE